jgi:catechol 2,3-dioxygenase-like lactoylglutathione lyase family enzyme
MVDTGIKVRDIAFVRFSAPDLEKMERFLGDFGLVTAERSGDALYVRGTDPSPWLHSTRRGEAGFIGIGLEAASAEDLSIAAGLEGASPIEELKDPAGGLCVRFTDPDGFQVEVVHGRRGVEPLPVRRSLPFNKGSEHPRLGAFQRLERGPSQVKRLGHAVIRVADFRRSEAWYKQRFGFLSSDEIYLGERDNLVTAFMRCDRGEEYTDHHTLLCVGLGEPGFDHCAFEVEDFDAVMLGHEQLETGGYEHVMGVGRHILGSQIYDYWRDPWGHTLEHYTDGDLLNASSPTGLYDPREALGTQWGRMNVG